MIRTLVLSSIVFVASAAGPVNGQEYRRFPGRIVAPPPVTVVAPPVRIIAPVTPVYPTDPAFPTHPSVTHSLPTTSYPISLSRRDLERSIEHRLRSQFGHCLDEVDVEVDLRRREIEVDVEFRHFVPGAREQIFHLLHCSPELAGFRIRLDVDYD